jgi:hypothetical protein
MKTAATTSLRSVRSVADKAKSAFDIMGRAATGVNQALEIGRKAWGALQLVVGQTVAKALEFRAAGDPVSKWFKDMKRDTDLLKAAIGDALIPVIQGLAEGLGLVGRGARDWVRENRKIIASKVLEYFLNIGNVLVKSIAKGTLLVVKVWKGWQLVIDGVKAAGQAAFGAMLSGAAKAVDAMADVVAVFDEHLAEGMSKAAAEAREMGEAFSSNSQETIDAMFRTSNELTELENKINSVSNIALKKLGQAGVIAQKKIQESTVGTNRTLEEQKKLTEENAKRALELAAKVDSFLAARHEDRIKRLELREFLARKADEEMIERAEKTKEVQAEALDAMMSKADVAGDLLGGIVNTFAQEQERATQMMSEAQKAVAEGAADASDAVIDSVTTQVAALAVQAAAGAFASMASIPIVGPALGAGAAAAASAAVLALGAGLKGLVSMAQGGVVTGGAVGRDSVPAMLMPGEQVMSIPERQAMQRFMGRLLGAQAGQAAIGSPAANGAGGGRPVVYQNKTEIHTWEPDTVRATKMAKRLEDGARKRLARQELLLGQGGV